MTTTPLSRAEGVQKDILDLHCNHRFGFGTETTSFRRLGKPIILSTG